ncbi:50S ribosomal protein L17 [candidate division KSB1 bacterium]|nr:50S ribosomal protein L17 [candidate division KSB1 bacterium]
MRHRRTVVKLNRTASHRKALMANLSCALFERKHIETTEAKAKATRQFAEKLITLGKKGTVHARRIAYKHMRQKETVQILFDDIAPQYSERPGGYTRVVKLGQRQGDGASMAILELVGFETATKKKKQKDDKKAEAAKKKSDKKAEPEPKKKESEKKFDEKKK